MYRITTKSNIKQKMKRLTTKHFLLLIALLIFGCLVASCASVHTTSTPNFENYQSHHQTIAIIPFDISIDNKAYENAFISISVKSWKEIAQRKEESFRRSLFTQLSLAQQAGRYTVEIQDIDETITLLQRASDTGMIPKNLAVVSKSKICEILKVDAIISGSMAVTLLRSTWSQIRSRIGLGFGPPDRTDITVSIHESETETLIWNYDLTARGVLRHNYEGVSKRLKREIGDIARNFPYKN